LYTSQLHNPGSLWPQQYATHPAVQTVDNPEVSKDKNIREAGIETKTGRKWSASRAVYQTKSAFKTTVGNHNYGTPRTWSIKTKKVKTLLQKQK